MSEYERIVAAYDDNPKCHNYDFSVARARVAELKAENRQLGHDLAKFPPRRERITELEVERDHAHLDERLAARGRDDAKDYIDELEAESRWWEEKLRLEQIAHTETEERAEQAEAELAKLKANRTEILDSAWNTANERAIKAEATIERLKVCGTCNRWRPVPDADDTYCCTCIVIGADPARAFDTCARWTERDTR